MLKKYLLWIMLVVLLCNPVSIMAGSVAAARLHDWLIMERFSRPFFDYPLPENTVETGRIAEMQYDGAHGCSFVATRTVKTDLSSAEIKAYFDDVGFKMPHGEPDPMDWKSKGLVRVMVTEAEDHYVLKIWGGGFYTYDILDIGCR